MITFRLESEFNIPFTLWMTTPVHTCGKKGFIPAIDSHVRLCPHMLSFMMLRSTIGEAKAYGALKVLTGHIQENCMDCRPHLTTSIDRIVCT
jgi:hypothetical protein